MGRSVGNSRVCPVKSFEIPQSTRIDRIARNPYTLPVKKKDLGKLKRKPPHDEKENEEQMETGRAHQSLPDRREIEKPEAVTRHSDESQRRIARVFHERRAFLSVNCRGNSICLGRMTAPFEGGVETDKRPATYVYLIKLFLFLLRRR